MKKIAYVLLGLGLAYGIYILSLVKEKFEFVDKAVSESSFDDEPVIMARKIELRSPDNSIEFFEDLKSKSEENWGTIELNENRILSNHLR